MKVEWWKNAYSRRGRVWNGRSEEEMNGKMKNESQLLRREAERNDENDEVKQVKKIMDGNGES